MKGSLASATVKERAFVELQRAAVRRAFGMASFSSWASRGWATTRRVWLCGMCGIQEGITGSGCSPGSGAALELQHGTHSSQMVGIEVSVSRKKILGDPYRNSEDALKISPPPYLRPPDNRWFLAFSGSPTNSGSTLHVVSTTSVWPNVRLVAASCSNGCGSKPVSTEETQVDRKTPGNLQGKIRIMETASR